MAEQYHKVYARIWENPAFRSYSDDGRLAGLYVLTCPHRTTEGLFRLPLAFAQYELAWTDERTDDAFAELQAASFIERDPAIDYVWLVNALKWNTPKGPKQVAGAANHLSKVPESPLRGRYLLNALEVCPPLAQLLETKHGWAESPTPDTPSIPYRSPTEPGFDTPSIPQALALAPSQALAPSPPPPPPDSSETETTELAAAAAIGDSLLERIGYVGDAAAASADLIQYVGRALGRGWPTTELEATATEIGAMPDDEIEKTPRHVLLGALRKRANEDPPPEIAHQADGTSLDLSLDFHDLTGLPDDPDAEIAARYAEETRP